MKLRYSAESLAEIRAIGRFIARDNPAAAQSVLRRIRAAARRLQRNPYIGHKGAARGTLEWVVRGLPYIIVYEVHEDARVLGVISIVHGARKRGENLETDDDRDS